MKKIIKLTILIILSLSVYLIYIDKPKTKLYYISIGDGFAKGINPYQQYSYGYSDYLKEYLKHKDMLRKYSNFSYQDMMTKDIRKDILININDNKKENIKRALREADLLTLSVGINDLIYEIEVNRPLSEQKKEKIITKIVDNLKNDIVEIKKYYKKDIYILGYYNFFPQNSVERKMLDDLNSNYKQICGDKKIYYVDNSNIDNKLYNYLENEDSFYPNVRGYEQIYKNILNTIKIEKYKIK